MAASELEINNAIRRRAQKFRNEALTLTMRIVRRLLEDDLGLAEGSLEPQKKYISEAVDKVLNEETQGNRAPDGETGATTQGDVDKVMSNGGAPNTTPETTGVKGENVFEKSNAEKQSKATRHSKVDSEEEDGVTEAGSSGESDDDEEQSAVTRKGKPGSRTAGTNKGGRRNQKSVVLEDDEESEDASGDNEDGSEDEEEREEQEKMVVKRAREQKAAKSNGRRKSEAQSDQGESEEEAGSSDSEAPAPRKRQRKGGGSSSEGDSSAESGDSDEEPSDKHKSKNAKGKKGKDQGRSQASQAAYLTSERVAELKSILKQCGIMISPALYKKAKDADAEDREAVLVRGLKDLLKKEGLSSHPSDKEIKRVKKRLQTQKELEGIDTGNILEEGGRGSRRAAREAATKVPLYTDASDSDEEEGGSDDEEEDDEESGGEEDAEGEDD